MKTSLVLLMILIMSSVNAVETSSIQTPSIDDSILTQEPCALPCWYGLTPGITTLDEVNQTIETISFVTSAVEREVRMNGPETFFLWRYGTAYRIPWNGISIRDNILHSIKIYPNISFTLQDIISIYGEPAGFSVRYVGPYVYPAELTITLYYPQVGLVVEFLVYQGRPSPSYPLLGESLGQYFWLYEPANTLEEFFARVADYTLEDATIVVPNYLITDWPGIGSAILQPVINYRQCLDFPPLPTILTATPNPTAPTINIARAGTQPALTNASPIVFTANFNEPVTGFDLSDVDFTGSTNPGSFIAYVCGGAAAYTICVSGMSGDGIVVANILSNAAQNAAGVGNTASSGESNTVTYDLTIPTTPVSLSSRFPCSDSADMRP
jgi:hypothetical protein